MSTPAKRASDRKYRAAHLAERTAERRAARAQKAAARAILLGLQIHVSAPRLEAALETEAKQLIATIAQRRRNRGGAE